jgi:hypothetical protein
MNAIADHHVGLCSLLRLLVSSIRNTLMQEDL